MERSAGPALASLLALSLSAGCHTTRHVDETVQGGSRLRDRDEPRAVLEPTAAVTERGDLRLVRPLVCDRDVLAEQLTYRQTTVEPNLATVIVGLVMISAGGVSTVIGLSDEDPGSAPETYLGAAGVAVGLPLTALPFFGTGEERELRGEREVVRGTRRVRCGLRPLEATRAVLDGPDLEVRGALDPEGRFEVPVFSFVDAFAEITDPVRLEVRASSLEGEVERFRVFLRPSDLAAARSGFFERAGIDARVERMLEVPRLRVEVARAELRPGEREVSVRFRVKNQGPGEAYGVRAIVTSDDPALNGRIFYFGAVESGEVASAGGAVRLPEPRDGIEEAGLAFLLRDAHGAAPQRPIPIEAGAP